MKKVGSLALALSVLLHVALAYFGYTASKAGQFAQNTSGDAIQVETIAEKDYLEKLKDRYKNRERQIVQMDDRQKSEVAPDKKQKNYLSKFDQNSDQNMRAANVGKFKNVDREGIKSSASVAKLFELPKDLLKAEDEAKEKTKSDPTGRLFMPRAPSRSPASAGSEGDGYSATDDYLKDVVVGAQTLLNTEEYKFYSFYARVREALSSQWSYRVKQELTQIYAGGEQIQGGEKITKVEVRLSANGDLLQARVLSSSGYRELDKAASDAFQAAAPFPHPPSEMIDHHDEVSIKWDFVVYASEQSGIKIQVQRGGM